jgi:hypothetical protein
VSLDCERPEIAAQLSLSRFIKLRAGLRRPSIHDRIIKGSPEIRFYPGDLAAPRSGYYRVAAWPEEDSPAVLSGSVYHT